ncbi:MAG: hypothetical protein PGMFKBFP_02270 [Anaerolineales bacterium]|nr:hypothetical protein [Anaerolineales bacterium]
MMRRDIVGKQRLNIYNNSSAEFQNSYALIEYRKKFIKVKLPFMGIILAIIFKPKIIGRRRKNQINGIIRQ